MIKIKSAIGIGSILLGGIGLFVETHSVDAALVSAIILIGMGIASIAARKNSRWLCLIFACGSAFGAYMSMDVFPTLYTALAYMIVAVHVILFYIEISCPKETPQKQENKENNSNEND